MTLRTRENHLALATSTVVVGLRWRFGNIVQVYSVALGMTGRCLPSAFIASVNAYAR